jgi:hypothetical protein
MNKNKLWLFAIPLAVMALFVFSLVPTQTAPAIATQDNIRYKASVCETMFDASEGTTRSLGCTHNLLTNAGKEIIEKALSTPGLTVLPINISVGAGANPVVGDTVLDGIQNANGFTGAVGTIASNAASSGNWSVWKTFTATALTTLNVTGLYGDTNYLTLFAASTFTQTVFDVGDTLRTNWTVSIT